MILIGLPGAGKSTFYGERFAATHLQVSKDLMPRSAAKEKRQREQVAEALRVGRSLVVDNVNARAADRAWLIAQAHAAGMRAVGYFFDTPASLCLARNRLRVGAARVPAVAIHAAAKRLEPPSPAEGFDALLRVRPRPHNGDKGFEVVPMV